MWSEFKAAWVISAALMIVFVTIFFLGTIERFFRPRVQIEARTSNVQGLTGGAPVWLLGVPVGSVERVTLSQEGATLSLSIDKDDLKYIHQDAHAVIRTMGLLGEKYVEIVPGKVEAGPLNPNAFIPVAPEFGLKEILATSTKSIEQVDRLIGMITGLVERIEKGQGTLAQLITNPDLYENLNQVITSLASALKEAEGSHGTLQLLIKDPNLYKNLDRAARQLAAITARINKGEGLAGDLLKNQALPKEVQEILASLRELIDDIKKNPKKYFTIKVF